MAPEQVEGRPIDGRTDLYALACAAFEMLTGRPPFQREQDLAVMWAQVSTPPPPIREFRPDLPAEVDQVMSKALAKAPDSRHATCMEFATDLRAAFTPRPSGQLNISGTPAELAGAIGPVPPATELALASPAAGPAGQGGSAGVTPPAGASPPAGSAQPPVGAGQAPGAAVAPASEATITDAAVGGAGAGSAQGTAGAHAPRATTPEQYAASGYGPGGARYQQGGYGQDGYGAGYVQSGYGAPGQADPRWGGPGYRLPAGQGQPPRRRKALPIVLAILVIAILAGSAIFVLQLRGSGSSQGGPSGGVTTGTRSSHSVSPSRSPSSSPATSPDTVVTNYYTAINDHDYRTAYRLNEKAQSDESFTTFKVGFTGTRYDNLTITGVTGETVSINLTADQTDGSVKTYEGTYTVRHGKIVDATIKQTG
jgi:hypothetical protein